MKLLMIEDNKSVSEMMQMFFQKEGGMSPLLMTELKLWISLMKALIAGI